MKNLISFKQKELKIIKIMLFIFIIQYPYFVVSKENQKIQNRDNNAVATEILVSQSESKAISSLENLVRQSEKNKSNLIEILNLKVRLAELYFRKTKTSRFMELFSSTLSENEKKSIHANTTNKYLTDSLNIYNQILKECKSSQELNKCKKYSDYDIVLFNSSLVYKQLNKINFAIENLETLTIEVPQSSLWQDAQLELGEIYFQLKNFNQAIHHFKQINSDQKTEISHLANYKTAWCYYNIKEISLAIQFLIKVIKSEKSNNKLTLNLKNESLKDLSLFLSDMTSTQEIYTTIRKEFENNEDIKTAEIYKKLNQIFLHHSKYKEVIDLNKLILNDNTTKLKNEDFYHQNIQAFESLKDRKSVVTQFNMFSKYCKEQDKNNTCFTHLKQTSENILAQWWKIKNLNKTNQEFNLILADFLNIFTQQLNFETDNFDEFMLLLNNSYNLSELYIELKMHEKANEILNSILMQKQKIYKIFKKNNIEINKELTQIYFTSLYHLIYNLNYLEELNKINTPTKNQLLSDFFNDFITEDKFNISYLESKEINDLILAYLQITLKLKDFKPLNNFFNSNKNSTIKLKKALSENKEQSKKSVDLQIVALSEQKKYSESIDLLNKELAVNKNEQLSELKETFEIEILINKIINQSSEDKIKTIKNYLTKISKNSNLFRLNLLISKELNQQNISNQMIEHIVNILDPLYLKLNSEEQTKNKHEFISILQNSLKKYEDQLSNDQLNALIGLLNKYDPQSKINYSEIKCQLLIKKNDQTKLDKIDLCFKNLISDEKNKNLKKDYLSIYYDTLTKQQRINQQIKFLKTTASELNETDILYEVKLIETKELCQQKKYEVCYKNTLDIIKHSKKESTKLASRFLQGEIFQYEFKQQSLKAKSQQLELVFSIKAEKFEKTLLAFNEVLSKTLDSQLKYAALNQIKLTTEIYIEDLNKNKNYYDSNLTLAQLISNLLLNLKEQNLKYLQQLEEVQKLTAQENKNTQKETL